MTEDECLKKMIAPGQVRPNKPYRKGVIQIHITRACDQACFHCTQGSNLGGKTEFMSPEHFEQAVRSLGFDSTAPYFGVCGVFGGNPALSPHFAAYCDYSQTARAVRATWIVVQPSTGQSQADEGDLLPIGQQSQRASLPGGIRRVQVRLAGMQPSRTAPGQQALPVLRGDEGCAGLCALQRYWGQGRTEHENARQCPIVSVPTLQGRI